MSTEPGRMRGEPAGGSRREAARRRRGRTFAATFAIVVGVLAAVGLAGAAASVATGPRVTDVRVDPAAAVAASGSRLILTTSQSLADVDASQVTIEPATPFAVDTSGRSIGIRFALPLWEGTEYTVTIVDVQGLGGGPASTIVESFTTPPAEVYLLQRSTSGDDAIFLTDLGGESAVPVFTHPHIEDFRATASHLVVSVRDDADDTAALIVAGRDGADPRELALPGDGYLSNLQSADRGDLVGYTYSDRELGEAEGRESMLYTVSVKDAAAEPTRIEVPGADPRVAEWRFVPDTDSILLLSFDGSLLLTGSGSAATALGTALSIDGIARGSSEAVVERLDQLSVIDLTDASEEPLVESDDDLGALGDVLPLPDGSTLRTSAELGADGFPSGRTSVALVAADGSARVLFEASAADAVLQTCVSPSSRYVAILVAPDAVANPYDTYQLPLPERLETHVLELADGAEVVALAGSSISWCQVGPG